MAVKREHYTNYEEAEKRANELRNSGHKNVRIVVKHRDGYWVKYS